ncbi:protein giant-like [Contarinia nasturtii]|uniref:protein giant-like n=1 Tax=Contarinia nasturtii TaxID=265458 RepID=UPI0012D3B304|nr:protein giant-like [Contarinia nasturtii]
MNAMDAIAMMNQGILMKNIKHELSEKNNTNQFGDAYSEILPIDLSRHCDSVETRKTPSPYSSGFGESSPSQMNESPSSLMKSSSNFSASVITHNRSDTPPSHYHSSQYLQRTYSSNSDDSSRFAYKTERSPSPPESMHHRYMHEQSINGGADEINPYILHAVAIQQKLQSIPATVSTSGQCDIQSFPMVMGRDGKLARPFKAYPRDPLSITTTLPSTDPLTDRVSTERFNIFRQQMLDQIHAANGGRPTITNPKMRRNSIKIERTSNEFQIQQQQQPQPEQMQQQQQQKAVDLFAQVSSQSDESVNNKNEAAKDNAYYERRRKNNAAAKKSRDRRRIKEDEIAIRAAFLERENLELKIELATARRQLANILEKK